MSVTIDLFICVYINTIETKNVYIIISIYAHLYITYNYPLCKHPESRMSKNIRSDYENAKRKSIPPCWTYTSAASHVHLDDSSVTSAANISRKRGNIFPPWVNQGKSSLKKIDSTSAKPLVDEGICDVIVSPRG